MQLKISKGGGDTSVTTEDVIVDANRAKEAAKYESQQTTIITAEDIAKKQAKSVEDIIFNETGVTRTVDAMGRVGVSIRGAEPRHTLILVDGQPVMGDISKYQGAGDELQRMGTENVERIEIVKGSASAKYGSDAIGGVINVVTRKAQKDAGLQVNVEGRRAKGNSDIFPYQNVFLRADSGQMGNLRLAMYGSKRDIMPTYSIDERVTTSGEKFNNSLRYYGDIKNIGIIGTYDINERNSIDFNVDRTKENMERYLKRSDASEAPRQQYKRDVTRDKESITYTGNNGGSTDWNVNYTYSKMTEDDIALSSNYGHSQYEGKNILNSVDDVVHKQWNFNASANTQVNDKHLLTYGFGYVKEEASGSRLKSAPHTWQTSKINPWDYDKNLYTKGGTGTPASTIHAYPITYNAAGVPQYDAAYDMYGIKDANGHSVQPVYTYDMYLKDLNGYTLVVPPERQEAYKTFQQQLIKDNPVLTAEPSAAAGIVRYYYSGLLGDMIKWSNNGMAPGKAFNEQYRLNNNTIYQGKASLNKYNFFLQDTWQVNDNTIVSPILRVDHSNLFGSEFTFNMGLTHNINGKANHRFKANIGTGYTEPGMGELYYNWEMYAGALTGDNEGRLGYYWIGNPNLKPEKSVNVDLGIEAENGKTSTRLNVFHNQIKDYMSTYFTGYLMDYYPNADPSLRFFLQLPDMIYSFKNIGKAEITGVEAEVNHQFDDHWSGRLGYTYLHAINKSDPTMPRQLLDKPQHKVDIGVTYENKKGGWRASLWGNYYIHMLDSNSIANNGNTMYYDGKNNKVVYNFAEGGKQTYEKKTFGIWNFLVQKDLSKDSSMYVGVDNIFNHRDDDRALQERVYRMGFNMKFGADKDTPMKEAVKKVTRDAAKAAGVTNDDSWFIQAPFDTTKEQGVELLGDYRARWNSFTGKKKPEARVTETTSVGTAEKNVFEKAGHGFEQRLRLGVDARIGDNTNVTVLGSASGMNGVDTAHDISNSRGLNHQRVENIDVTQHANKWDFSIGRLTEPMGITGYWFGKEYDGARAVWTSGKDQVRLGYGDFSQSTGITDSAYMHAVKQQMLRPPTKAEWLGVGYDENNNEVIVNTPGYTSVLNRLENAKTWAEEKQILQETLDIIKEKDPDGYKKLLANNKNDKNSVISVDVPVLFKYTIKDKNGKISTYISNTDAGASGNFGVGYKVQGNGINFVLGNNEDTITKDMQQAIDATYYQGPDKADTVTVTREFYGIGYYNDEEGTQRLRVDGTTIKVGAFSVYVYASSENLSKEEIDKNITKTDIFGKRKADDWKNNISWGAQHILTYLKSGYDGSTENTDWSPENNSSMPLTFFADGSVGLISVLGTVLQQDTIPSIDKAAFVQYKHQFGNTFGVQAWYLHSMSDDTHAFMYANGKTNDVYTYDQLANVLGIGAKWKLGNNAFFSFDWGQNRTDFGRMMNGHSVVQYTPSDNAIQNPTAETFDYQGRASGGIPRFWVARVDIGKSDMDVPGSWNAFADYKYFQHGSFFGGNGTEGVPDRYLDGIKSFTIGGGYVPAKNLLLEAFYTFDAQGIGQRDTLYGPESFTLGDYTCLQLTYRF